MIAGGRQQFYSMSLHQTHFPPRTRPKPPRAAALSQPHDAFFRWAFSQHRHAVGLLKACLPPEMVAATTWGTLRLESGTHVDRSLRRRHCDLVFSARMRGKPVFFYVLVEQQRDVEPLMIFRMGIYMMRRWEQLVRDHPGATELPPIFPLLIHHSDTGWTAATAFQDLVVTDPAVGPALRPYIPHFEMRLVDLSAGQVTHLVEGALTALGLAVLWCLSVADDDARMEREIERIRGAVNEMAEAGDEHAAFEVLLRYLFATHRRLSAEQIGNLLDKAAGPKAREAIVTVMNISERKWLAQGRAEMLLQQLTLRFGAVPAQASARVMAANKATLSRWAARVLTAPTLADVLDEEPVAASAGASPARRPSASKRAR
jgi:hypothetical protein